MQDVVLDTQDTQDTQESFLDNLFKVNNTFIVSGKKFTVLSKLGKGTYGTVYKVQIVDEQGVTSYKAAKVITTGNNQGILSLRELDIMAKFLHPNLIHNHGLLIQSSLERTAVIILMPIAQTDLFAMMRSDTLTVFQKLNILYDIVLGVNYLHNNNYLHLDLKPMNILIFEDATNKRLKAKITDFGLSLGLEEDKKYYPQELVTLTYRAPEILEGNYNYTVKSDIWSLGIIFLEVLSGGKSLFRVFNENSVLKDIKRYLSPQNIDNVLNTYLYPVPLNIKVKTIALLKSMLDFNPEGRPTTDQILLNSLFDIVKKDKDNGVIIPVERLAPKECSLIYYYGYDYMIRIAASLKIKLETVFLASDIYQRSLRYGFNLTGTFAKDWPNIALLASSSLYLAIKTTDNYYASPKYFSKVSNNMFTAQDVLNMEAGIIQLFNGIIYPTNLFTVSNSKERLLQAFPLLRNCNIYYKLDLAGWSNIDRLDQYPKYNKYILFRQFFKDTEYYKLIRTSTQEVYLPQIFNSDKNRLR